MPPPGTASTAHSFTFPARTVMAMRSTGFFHARYCHLWRRRSRLGVYRHEPPSFGALELSPEGRVQQRDDVGVIVGDGVQVVHRVVAGLVHVVLRLVPGQHPPPAVEIICRLVAIHVADTLAVHGDSITGDAATAVRRQLSNLVGGDLEHLGHCAPLPRGLSWLPDIRTDPITLPPMLSAAGLSQ